MHAKSMPNNGIIIQWTEMHAKSMQYSFTKLKATCNLNSTQGYFNGKTFKIDNKTSGSTSDTLIQWNTSSYA